MFEDRLQYLRKRIESLGNSIGYRPVIMTALRESCERLAELYGYQLVVIYLPPGMIDPKILRGFSKVKRDHRYVIVINRTEDYEKNWYFAAHECGHVLLHHLYLLPPDEESSSSSPDFLSVDPAMQEVEEEAHFFAQLCFWPLNQIFSDDNPRPPSLNEAGLIQALVDYQKEQFDAWGYDYLDHKLHLYAYLFLRRMERLLPRNYNRLLNQYYPIF